MTPLPQLLAYKPHRDVLAMVGHYHWVTSLQVQRYLGYANKQYGNKLLKELTQAGYLSDANWVPKAQKSPGNPPTVWSLTPRGGKALASMGIEVDRRITYSVDRSQSFMAHTNAVNDALIACELFALEQPAVELIGFLHEETFKREQINPKPDGWVSYRIGDREGALLLEIDRGTEGKRKWIEKVVAYMDFIEGPQSRYKALGDPERVQVAVVVRTNPTQRIKDAQERCAELIDWTEQALGSDLGPLFAFTDVDPVLVSPTTFFTGPHWFSPHDTQAMALIPKERLS